MSKNLKFRNDFKDAGIFPVNRLSESKSFSKFGKYVRKLKSPENLFEERSSSRRRVSLDTCEGTWPEKRLFLRLRTSINYLLGKLVNKLVVGEGQLTELGELADNRREKTAELLGVVSETGVPDERRVLTADAQVTLDGLEGIVVGTVEIEGSMREKYEREKEEWREVEFRGVELHWRS
ncbi:hypothetical protein Cgig2_004440 [Carnegiea gigantea]|uniref:Uncharacterized protein n=1 Tax=Carnegiea gigantea TaxID=171969 RepID=A0A9Q1JUQ3_9CARY|nr:hypothetical protein Cgig2_004440 [Carnegiea gigantea]